VCECECECASELSEIEACALHASWLGVAHSLLSIHSCVPYTQPQSARVRDRSHSAYLSDSSNTTLAAVSVVSTGDHNTIRKQAGRKLTVAMWQLRSGFLHTQPRSVLQDARYQLLGRKPTDLALSSNRTVSACVIRDDSAEYCLCGCDVIQLEEN
jgi:hypothetical protein